MNVKELKTYLESNGFIYVGDAKFHKDVENAKCLEDETKQLIGSLTFSKSYVSEHEGESYTSKIEYYVTRNVVIMSFVNSLGQKRKVYRAALRDIQVNDQGQLIGFEDYQSTWGLK